jgi:sulfoxide reductase heme-binding subunit YedZ
MVAHVVLAAGVTALATAWIPDRDAAGALVRGSGIAALIWAYAGLVVGLVVGTKWSRGRSRPLQALHRRLNLVVLALMGLHALVWALAAPGGSLLVALVPQTAPVSGLAYSAGVLSLYLAVLLGPSWYLRHRLPKRFWLVVHQFAALSYAIALWHGLVLGSEFRFDGAPRVVLWVAQLPLLALLVLRLLVPRRPGDRLAAWRSPAWQRFLRSAVILGVAAAAFVILAVVLLATERGLHPG